MSRGLVLKSVFTPFTYFYSSFFIAPEMLNFNIINHRKLYNSENQGVFSDKKFIIRLEGDGSSLVDENTALFMRARIHGL